MMTYENRLPDPETQTEFYHGVAFKRLLAWCVDTVLTLLATFLVGLFTFGLGWLFFPVFFFVINAIYRWVSLSSGSATLGMRLMAIEIRNAQGARLDSNEAALHTLGFLICSAFALPQLISAAMMAFGTRGQGLHDLFLGTTAINRPG
ncbi:MAG: RDD family protein [Pseudomonadota bacterium]